MSPKFRSGFSSLLIAVGLINAGVAAPTLIADNFSCPTGWKYYGYNCYRLTNSASTWPNARLECQGYGGDLAVVDSAVQLIFFQRAWSATTASCHIGLYKDATTGIFTWADGVLDSQHLTRYDPNYLTVASNLCFYTAIGSGNTNYYYDEPCTSTLYGICQLEASNASLALPYEEASVRQVFKSAALFDGTVNVTAVQCAQKCNSMQAAYRAVVGTTCFCLSSSTNLSSISPCQPASCSSPIMVYPTHRFLQYQLNATSLLTSCPAGAEYFEGSCYWLLTATSAWANQRAACQSIAGGDLLIIRTLEEQAYVSDVLLQDWNHSYRFDVTPWIGLQNGASVTGLSWVDLSLPAASFGAYVPVQTYTTVPLCYFMNNRLWQGDSCNNARAAICKSASTVTAQPSQSVTRGGKLTTSYRLFSSLETTAIYAGGGYYTEESFSYTGSNFAYGSNTSDSVAPWTASNFFLAQPGFFEVNVQAKSFKYVDKAQSSMLAWSTMDLLNASFVCPTYALQFYQIQCILEILGGSVTAYLDFADGKRKSDFTTSGSGVYTVGPSFSSPSTQTTPLSTAITVFMATAGLNYKGKIYAWEFDAASEGSITFLIWRPSCLTGMMYCHKSVACVASISQCNQTATFLTSACSPNSFSISTRQCIVTANGGVPLTNAKVLPVATYYVANSTVYTVPRRGYQILQLTDQQALEVQPGDYIGYSSSVAALNYRDRKYPVNDRTNYTFLYVSTAGSITFMQTSGAAGVTAGSYDLFLRAHVARYVQYKIKQTFTSTGLFNVRANITSLSGTTMYLASIMQVDTEIQNMTIKPMIAGALNKNSSFGVNIKAGTSVMYRWDFNDSTIVTSNATTGILHIFTMGGLFTVSVTATNPLSQGVAYVRILFLKKNNHW